MPSDAVGRTRVLETQGLHLADPGEDVHLVLSPEPAAVRAARVWVREQAPPLGPEVSDALDVVVSEVVTNVVLHARTRFTLGVSPLESGVLVTVADHSPVEPVPRDAAPDAGSGRGLALLSALCDSWGVERDDHGKVVWFVLLVDGAGSTR